LHYSATAFGEERTVSFSDLLDQGDNSGDFCRQTELFREFGAIGHESRSFDNLINADEKSMIPIAFDGYKVEARQEGNPIISRRISHPMLKRTSSVPPFNRAGRLHIAVIGERVFAHHFRELVGDEGTEIPQLTG
jgi:hypothetical protein